MAGWLGSLKTTLQRAETTHQPRPEGGAEIVDLPQGEAKLRKAIVAVCNELVEAQAERHTYHQAWALCLQEIETAFAKNTQRQRDAANRLVRLQGEWVKITDTLRIKSEIVECQIDDTLPDVLSTLQSRRDG